MRSLIKNSSVVCSVIIISTVLILSSVLVNTSLPALAAPSAEGGSLSYEGDSSDMDDEGLPKPTPTATPGPDSKNQLLQEQSLSQQSPPADRGIDPSTLIVNLFDASDLREPVRTLRWRDPLLFQLECYGEMHPFAGCELVNDLTEGGNWSVKWEGQLIVPEAGEYTFRLPKHDDGVRVLIDGSEIVDMGWRYPDPDQRPSPQKVFLSDGVHDIVVDYEQRVPFAAELEVRWQGPGFTEEVLPVASVGRPTIGSIEFTQAIQEFQTVEQLKQSLESNGEPPVPIVAHKPAVVRFYFNEVQSVTYARIRLQIQDVVLSHSAQLLQPHCTIEEQRLKANGCNSIDIYFTPPEGDWTASIEVYDIDGNLVKSDNLTVTSRNSKSFQMVPVTVCDRETKENEYECESGFQLPDFLPLLRSSIPTDQVEVVWDVQKVHVTDIVDTPAINVDWWLRLVLELNKLYWAESRPRPDQYYFGMVRSEAPDGGEEGAGGIGWRRGGAIRVLRPPEFQGYTSKGLAHEVGHLLKRKHPNTGDPDPPCKRASFTIDRDWPYEDNYINEVGFDVSHGNPLGAMDTYEIMSYCLGEDKWVSPHTYNGEMNALSVSSTQNVSRVSGSVWNVSGFMHDGELRLEPIFLLENPVSHQPSSGPYTIEVLDSTGNTLLEQHFELERVNPLEFLGEGSGLIFSELVPFHNNGSLLVIKDLEGVELAAVDLTGQAPIIIPSELPGEKPLIGEQVLQWQALDPDSDSHIFRVEYIPEYGDHHILAWGFEDTNLEVNFDELPACSEDCMIRITASDGANTGEGLITGFQVSSKAPSVEVNFPEDDSVFQGGQAVWLQASSWDPDDRSLPDTAEVWISNLDGELGNGDELVITDLSEGRHQITFTATDSDGNTASDKIDVYVDSTPPSLELFVVRDDIPSSCVDVKIDASDESGGSGLAAVDYSLDGGESWVPISLHQLPYSFVIPETGRHHVVARSFDAAGNINASDVPSITVAGECSQLNEPPTADAGGPYTSAEGRMLRLSAYGSSDPDGNINRYEWDLDQDGLYDDAEGVDAEVVFGDNGVFTVAVKVTDEGGLSDTDTADVRVDNLDPVVVLETGSPVSFAGGEGFLGRIGIPQTHKASASDLGSDDLVFNWSFGVSNVYFNDGIAPDPLSSPGGSYPFLVTDVAESVFDFPGLYSIRVKVVDDDGGEDVDELPKLVTGDAVCIRSMGFWKHQFSGRGHQHVDDRMLVGYLEGINFASAYFSEVVPLTDIEKAGEVLDIQGQEMRDKAEAQLFAAWLNFMNGAVDWDDDIEMEDDEKGSIPFHQIIADIENILLDPDASSTSLEQAKELAETVNEIVEESSACEFDQEDLAEDEDEGENDVKGEEKSGVDVETPRNKKGRGKGSE